MDTIVEKGDDKNGVRACGIYEACFSLTLLVS